MGDCRNRSVQIPFVPLRPVIADVEVTIPVPGAMAVDIVFDRPMDTASLPTVGTFTITSDGVPLVVTPIAWSDPIRLGCNTTGTPPAVTGWIRQNVHDSLCISAEGTYARPQTDLQWFP